MGKLQRDKGNRGRREFIQVLHDADWQIDTITCGIKSEDLIGESPEGKRYSIEVKYHEIINIKQFLAQAKLQSHIRRLPWMLAIRIPQYPKKFLILSEDEEPYVL